jgi:CheY-like chemotaxis protein
MSLKKYSNGQKVLIVDDIPIEVDRLKNSLSQYYAIRTYEDGKSALEFIQTDFHHFVIIPTNMKSMNSTIFIKELKKLVPKTNIVVSIEEKALLTIGNFIKLDVTDFLLKPFNQLQVEQVFSRLSKKVIEDMVVYKKSDALTKFILDTQPNINFILSSNKIVFANNAFYRFFEVDNLEVFENEYKNIANHFVEDVEHNYIGKMIEGTSWLKYILENQNEDFKVKIIHKDIPHIFAIKLNQDEIRKDIVVSLTNIDAYEKKTLETENELHIIQEEDEKLKKVLTFKNSYVNEMVNSIESQMELPIRTIKEIQKDILSSFKSENLDVNELYLGLKQTINMSNLITSIVRNFSIFNNIIFSEDGSNHKSDIKNILNMILILTDEMYNKSGINIDFNILDNFQINENSNKLKQVIFILMIQLKDFILKSESHFKDLYIKIETTSDYNAIVFRHSVVGADQNELNKILESFSLTFVKDIVEKTLEGQFEVKETHFMDTTGNKDLYLNYHIKLFNISDGINLD